MLISVVIPTLNRHELLLEAARSVATQAYRDWEVIVVDDGSDPPVSEASLLGVLGNRTHLVRNAHALGIARAKNAGVRAASGEIILILDDDDLLASDALAIIAHEYHAHPEVDCLFMGVEPFGPYTKGPARSRDLALERLKRQCNPEEIDGILMFSEKLFDALLLGVPIDFQRPAARRGTWNIIGGFEEDSLFSESAWAIKAAASCKVALTVQALTRWRIHDSNFGWIPNLTIEQNNVRHIENGLRVGKQLLHEFSERKSLAASQYRQLRAAYATSLFAGAYSLRAIDRSRGMPLLLRSFFMKPQLKHVRLALSYCVPNRLIGGLRRPESQA